MRANYLIFFAAFFAFLVSLNFFARADTVSLSTSEDSFIVGIQQTHILNVTVANRELQDDTFSISIFPSSQPDVGVSFVNYSIFVKAGKSESFQIMFNPYINAVPRAQVFTITAYSFAEQASGSKDVTAI